MKAREEFENESDLMNQKIVRPHTTSTNKCTCGENSPDSIVVHRKDGPCYLRPHTNTNSEWDSDIQELFEVAYCAFGTGTGATDDSRNAFILKIKGIIKKVREEGIKEERERIMVALKNLQDDDPQCYCRVYTFGEHDCGPTSNDLLEHIVSVITKEE